MHNLVYKIEQICTILGDFAAKWDKVLTIKYQKKMKPIFMVSFFPLCFYTATN